MAGERRVLDAVDLERDEQQPRADLVDALLDALEEAADLGIVGAGGVQQLGIAADPAELLLDPLVALDHLGQRVAIELVEPALELALERDRRRLGRGEVALDLRRVRRGVEVAEIPLGQLGARRRGGRRRGLVAGLDHPANAPRSEPLDI